MTPIRTPALGILNDTDAPHQNMVAVVFGRPETPRWIYVVPRVAGNGEHQLVDPQLFRPLSDFGVHATLTEDGNLALNQLTISIARTPSGLPRPWQGSPSAIIKVTHHAMGFVMRAVHEEFEARREARAS